MKTHRLLLLIVLSVLLAKHSYSQTISFPTTITTNHPRVLVDKTGQTALSTKITNNAWASSTYNSIKGSGSSTTILDYYVNRHQTDSAWIVSRLQMYWKKKYTDVYVVSEKFDHGGGATAPVPTVKFDGARDWATIYSTPSIENVVPNSDSSLVYLYNRNTQVWEWTLPKNSGNIISGINSTILIKARDAAFLYWYTGNEKYAKFAYDIFKTYMYGMYYRNPPSSSTTNTIIGLQTFEVIHDTQINYCALCYDFLYDYIKLKSPADVDPNTGKYPIAFKKWINQIVINGDQSGNWNVIQAHEIAHAALVLENNSAYTDGKGCQYYLDLIFNQTSARQGAIMTTVNTFSPTTYLWYEAPGYAFLASEDLLTTVQLVDRVTQNNLLEQLPVLKKSVPASAHYLFPNFFSTGYGDTDYLKLTSNSSEILVSIARKYGSPEDEEDATRLIDMTYGYNYARPQVKNLYTLLLNVDALKKPAKSGTLKEFATPTIYMPTNNLFFQRNGFDSQTALAATVIATAGNHSHSNGIAMELYGKGYVLGTDPGRGDSYWATNHLEYYSKFLAHNTVVVNGKSNSANAYTLLGNYPASQQKSGYFPAITYSNVKLNESTTNSDQQRLTSTIRTAPTAGYYVDIFRSKVRAGGDVKHEYFYHNIGQTKSLIDTLGGAIATAASTDFATNATSGQLAGYKYFTNESSVAYNKSFNANFQLTDGANVVNMNMWMKGCSGRKIYLADSPKSGGFDNFSASYASASIPTVAVQQTGEAWNRPFVAVYEPYSNNQPKTITSISAFTPTAADADFVGLTILSLNNKKETVFSAIRNKLTTSGEYSFSGKYGVVSENSAEFNYLYLGSGKSISKGAWSISTVNAADSSAVASLAIDTVGSTKNLYFSASVPVNLTVPDTFAVGKEVLLCVNNGPIKYVGSRTVVNGLNAVRFSINQPQDYAPVTISTTAVASFVGAVPGLIEAENYDLGAESTAYHDSNLTNSGGKYRTDGVDIESCSAGGYNVSAIVTGEWLNYTINVKESCDYFMEIKVAAPSTTAGKFHITFNGVDQTGTITVPSTGSSQTWTTLSKTVSLVAGTQVMKIWMDGGDFSLDKIMLEKLRQVQTLTLPTTLTKNACEVDFSPATSSTGLPLSYTSSNPLVASVVGGQIHLLGSGTTELTVSQAGDELYMPVTAANTTTLTVNKCDQTLVFTDVTAKVKGGADFSPATTNSGLPINYLSSNESVATIVGGKIHINGTGRSTITASQGGNAFYNTATTIAYTLLVNVNTAQAELDSKSIQLYPNPVHDVLNIDFGEQFGKDVVIKLFTSTEVPILIQKITTQQCTLDLSTLSSGVYFLRIQDGSQILVRKILKQ